MLRPDQAIILQVCSQTTWTHPARQAEGAQTKAPVKARLSLCQPTSTCLSANHGARSTRGQPGHAGAGTVAGTVCLNMPACMMQGTVKPALGRLRDSLATRTRELSQELLALQEKRDAGLDALTERTEDNAALETMVKATWCNLGWKRVNLDSYMVQRS